MFCTHNPSLESRNYVDGLDFTRDDPCIWVVYPAGAAGDLLISILDKHYLRTGCEYYGINDRGKVMLYTSDYEMIDIALVKQGKIKFDDQWFYDFADQLGRRNLTYSMLDQVIFGCHMHKPDQISQILNTFSRAKIINIHSQDSLGQHLLETMRHFKLTDQQLPDDIMSGFQPRPLAIDLIAHDRVCHVPFGFLFDRDAYHRYYQQIRQFLGLAGPLICYDFIDFYLDRQPDPVARALRTYSQSL